MGKTIPVYHTMLFLRSKKRPTNEQIFKGMVDRKFIEIEASPIFTDNANFYRGDHGDWIDFPTLHKTQELSIGLEVDYMTYLYYAETATAIDERLWVFILNREDSMSGALYKGEPMLGNTHDWWVTFQELIDFKDNAKEGEIRKWQA